MKTTSRCISWDDKAVVYIARDKAISGFYKIGCSKDPIKRLKTIGSGDCEIVYKSHPDYCNGTEVYVHNLLHNERRIWKGSGKTEWFELSERQFNFVKSIIDNHSKNTMLRRKLDKCAQIIKEMARLIPEKHLDKFIKKVEEVNL